MTDAARLAHPARGDDNVEVVKPVESLALLNALREANVVRGEGPDERRALVHFGSMLLEDGARSRRKRRVDKDRCFRDLSRVHQADEVNQEFLRAFDRKGWNEKGAAGLRGGAHFVPQQAPTVCR